MSTKISFAIHTQPGIRNYEMYFIQEEKNGVLQKAYWSNERKGRLNHALQNWLNHYASGGAVSPKIPKGVGTDFQRRVWEEIQLIQAGYVMTYKELACRLGVPQAYRAVAQACKANPFALIVPCHRVIGSKDLGGYRWGITIKKALLFNEGLIEHPLVAPIRKKKVIHNLNGVTGKVLSRVYQNGAWWYLVNFSEYQDWFSTGNLT